MPVKEADPAAKSLDEAFASAMNAPARPKEPPAPKEIDPAAPHGYDDDGKPLAPFGLTKEGVPRKTAAGRPSKDDQARTAPAQPPGRDGKSKPEPVLAAPGQYAKELAGTADTLWLVLSGIGKAAPMIPLVGPRLPAQRIQAQAAVWMATKDQAVAALDLAAQHNAAAARFAARFAAGGDATWVIAFAALVMPVLSATTVIWSKDADAQLKAAEQPSLAELAERNEAQFEMAVAQMAAQQPQEAQA